jgi:hypothetical protein
VPSSGVPSNADNTAALSARRDGEEEETGETQRRVMDLSLIFM